MAIKFHNKELSGPYPIYNLQSPLVLCSQLLVQFIHCYSYQYLKNKVPRKMFCCHIDELMAHNTSVLHISYYSKLTGYILVLNEKGHHVNRNLGFLTISSDRQNTVFVSKITVSTTLTYGTRNCSLTRREWPGHCHELPYGRYHKGRWEEHWDSVG